MENDAKGISRTNKLLLKCSLHNRGQFGGLSSQRQTRHDKVKRRERNVRVEHWKQQQQRHRLISKQVAGVCIREKKKHIQGRRTFFESEALPDSPWARLTMQKPKRIRPITLWYQMRHTYLSIYRCVFIPRTIMSRQRSQPLVKVGWLLFLGRCVLSPVKSRLCRSGARGGDGDAGTCEAPSASRI